MNKQSTEDSQGSETTLHGVKMTETHHYKVVKPTEYTRLLQTEYVAPFPPPLNMLKSSPQCDGIRRWAFGRWSGHKGGALMSGISAHIKKNLGLPRWH